MATNVTSPQEFFGFQLGSDRHIASWNDIVKYYELLAKNSPCLQVTDLGPSTEGNPFLLVTISSEDNLKNLEHLRQVNQGITDPRDSTKTAIKELIAQGKAIVLQSMSLHATEIGGTQMAPELAYDMLTDTSEDMQRILDNVIFLMVPCFNPDGQLMVTKWYNKWLDTEYEGSPLPWLYHKYAGHDNNRDAYMQNLVESQYMAKLLFKEWRPHVYQDHHHMGSYGARYYVAPYSDPIRPDADPLIWRELAWYGAHMAYRLEEAGKSGILNGAQFPGWGHFGFHWITNHHNIAGMLTESASAKLATPLYIQPSQLVGSGDKTIPAYEAQTNFPNPWPGGWWRLRDIVEQKKISALAILDMAAKNKDIVLWNAYQKAKRQTERGKKGRPYAYIISQDQHDPLTVNKLVQVMLNQGVEVKQASDDFKADGVTYAAGTYVIFLEQPKMGLIKQLLGRQIYPETYWTTRTDGSPAVFDVATDNVAEYMGVKVVGVDALVPNKSFEVICQPTSLPVCPTLPVGGDFIVWDGRLNDSYILVNKLLAQGVQVGRLNHSLELDNTCLPAGAFYVASEAEEDVLPLVKALGIPCHAVTSDKVGDHTLLSPLRIGMYQRYYGGNADEGWTRLLLENFGFSYVSIQDEDIAKGRLKDIDVFILPSDMKQLVMGLTAENLQNGQTATYLRRFVDTMPPEYKSGLGKEGALALKDFVYQGGRLIAMNKSCDVAIEICDLQVKNVVAGLSSKEFYTHGSTLKAVVDNDNPLAYGMPRDAWVFNWESPAFQVLDTFNAQKYKVIVSYPERHILQSGRLVGEDVIKGKAAMLAVESGKGEVILIGAPPQHRGQTHGTFKLLFNALY